MHLSRLHLRNFRCFAEQSFDLNRHLTVLIGDNAAGKTTVLEAASVAAGSFLLGIGGEAGRSIHREDIRYVPHDEGGQLNFQPVTPTWVEAEGEVMGETLRWRRALGSEGGRTTTADARRVRELAAQAEAAVQSRERVTLPVLAYYGAGRLWQTRKQTRADRQGLSRSDRQRLRGYRGAIDPRVDARTFLDWMKLQAQIRFEEETEPLLLGLVRRAITGVTERASDVDYRGRWGDVVAFIDGRDPQPFSRLSDGQRTIVALAGDLATRMARLNPHLGADALEQTPGVVLIDEIETHLHPTWQRRILRDLRRTFPEVQFVVTTHSPQVLGEVAPEHVLNLTADGPDVPDRAYGLDSNAILTAVMGAESQNEDVDAKLADIFSAIQRKEPDAEERIRRFRAWLSEQGAPYDLPDLLRAEATLQRVRLLDR